MVRNETESMIVDCENRSEKLTDWESGFIDSIGDSLVRFGSLTDKQATKLESIWERVTDNG